MTAGTTDDVLARLLKEARARAHALDAEHGRLWDALCAAAEGGKRFRPALLTGIHDALGGTRPDAAAVVGAAVELLHTAFVVHDDVIDGDDVRRGRLNVSGTFRARAAADGATLEQADTYALTAGLLAGDLALTAAIRTVATCGAPPAIVGRLLDLFDAALQTTAAGELADVRLALGLAPASMAESIAMEAQKTSAYSFVLPLQAGAVLAEADQPTLDRLAEAGWSMGIAFQLIDDLLGVFGDPDRTGKSATSDLRTSKQTPLLVHAATTPQWPLIASHLGRDLDETELDEVRRLLQVSGSRKYVEHMIGQHLAGARDALDELGVDLDLLAELSDTAILAEPREAAA